MEQQLNQILARSQRPRPYPDDISSFLWFTTNELLKTTLKVKQSSTKQYTKRWLVVVKVPSFKSEQFMVIFFPTDGWERGLVSEDLNIFFNQETENKFKQQKNQIAELKKRLLSSGAIPGTPTNEDLPTIIKKMLQQLEIMLTKAKQSLTKQYVQGWITTTKILDSGDEQFTVSLDSVVDFSNQKDFTITLRNSSRLQSKLKRQENEIETELKRLANTEKEQQLWNTLKNYKIQLNNLLQTHLIKAEILIKEKDYLQPLREFITYINQPENVQKPFFAISTPIKTMISEWFNRGVTIQELSTVFTNYLQDQLPLYWKELKTELGNYEALIDKIDQFVIDQNNYLTVLKALKANKDTVFANLNPTQQNHLRKLFDQGVTIEKLSKQFKQIQKQINIAQQQRKQKEAEHVKKRKQTKLVIGLGIGLGIPFLAGGGGLTYWLLRKYRN